MKRRTFLVGGSAAIGAGAWAAWSSSRAGSDYAAFSAYLRRPLNTDGGVAELIRMATLAPNGHNTQPWRFETVDQRLRITPDWSRRTPVVDPDDHHLFVSLGAAVENVAIAGAAVGLPGGILHLEDHSLAYSYSRGKRADHPLTSAIGRRQSTRSIYDGTAVGAGTLKALETAGRAEGVRLVLLTERKRIDAVRDLVVAGNNSQMDDPAFVAELKHWLRFSAASAMTHGDGLYAAASGNPSLPDYLGRPAFDLLFKKEAEGRKYVKQMDSSAGLAVFFADVADERGWVAVGRAVQRFLLVATLRGLACAFVNQPVEVVHLRHELAALAGEKGLRPDIVIRFGRGRLLTYSPRRSVAEVLQPRPVA